MFDSIFIKFGGMGDDNFIEGRVLLGFSEAGDRRRDIEVPVYLPADLELSHRELREAALSQALATLREAVEIAGVQTADDLDNLAKQNWKASELSRTTF